LLLRRCVVTVTELSYEKNRTWKVFRGAAATCLRPALVADTAAGGRASVTRGVLRPRPRSWLRTCFLLFQPGTWPVSLLFVTTRHRWSVGFVLLLTGGRVNGWGGLRVKGGGKGGEGRGGKTGRRRGKEEDSLL